jgi:predicted small integral membrane protein
VTAVGPRWGIKILIVAGLAGYLSLFVLNNLTDPRTNSAAIPRMTTMRELKAEPPLGGGVLWRAIDSPAVHRMAYSLVVAVQAIGAILLWWGAGLLGWAAATGGATIGLTIANFGLLVFVAQFVGFLLVGLWFSYWVKMGPIQQGHLTLLLVGLAAVIVVNLPA